MATKSKSNAVVPAQTPSIEEFREIRAAAKAALIKWFDAFEDRMLGVSIDRCAAFKAAQLEEPPAEKPAVKKNLDNCICKHCHRLIGTMPKYSCVRSPTGRHEPVEEIE